MAMKEKERVSAVKLKIQKGIDRTPEVELMIGIVSQALTDLIGKEANFDEKMSAYYYLKSDIRHAELCGIEPSWIKKIIRESGLGITELKNRAIINEAERIKLL